MLTTKFRHVLSIMLQQMSVYTHNSKLNECLTKTRSDQVSQKKSPDSSCDFSKVSLS